MQDQTAIIRKVSPSINDCELTFVGREPIDLGLAMRQHAGYRRVLEAAGLNVVELGSADDLPDSVFVEDCAVVFDEIAVITRPGAESRRREVGAVADAVRRFRPNIESIVSPGTLEGGDVLRIGKRFFVGVSTRTNAAGYSQFAAIAARFEYEAVPVRIDGSLHLKTAVTSLDDETVILNPNWLDASPFTSFRQIFVAESEPFAANTLSIDGVVHVSQKWPATGELIANAGFTTATLDISELEKAEAGLTCLSLIFSG